MTICIQGTEDTVITPLQAVTRHTNEYLRLDHNVSQCLTALLCGPAGVMYWGDAGLNKIESANLDGTGRRILLTETTAHYYAFQFHAGSIYFTDWASPYACLLFT